MSKYTILIKRNGKVKAYEYESSEECSYNNIMSPRSDINRKIESLTNNYYSYHECNHGKYLCINLRADLCSKVGDTQKKYIDMYSFIEDGYQILDEDGNILKFIINKCKNYDEQESNENRRLLGR